MDVATRCIGSLRACQSEPIIRRSLALMHLELMRDTARQFPKIDDPTAVTSARIWHCKYTSLVPIGDLVNLTALDVATYPDESLEPLATMTQLQHLSIMHLPKVTTLLPLGRLRSLTHLSLATLPSWDSSGKVTEVTGLAALRDLPLLTEIELFGVVPPERVVDDLIEIGSLRTARLSKYPKAEIGRLRNELESRSLHQPTD